MVTKNGELSLLVFFIIMNTDHYFEIGKTHELCEDYTVAGMFSDYSYVIVSDGCSSAEDVDIGARILCKCVESTLVDFYDPSTLSPSCLHHMIQHLSIHKAEEIKKSSYLNLNKYALYCTIIVAITDGKTTNVFIYGDGNVILRDMEDKMISYNVNYSGNAPLYMAYSIDKLAETNLLKEFQQIVEVNKNDDGFEQKTLYDIMDPIWFSFEQPLKTITIASDGLETYFNGIDHVDNLEVFDEVTLFKNYTGKFVKRRMQSMKRKYDKNSVHHDDDISVATIHFNEEN